MNEKMLISAHVDGEVEAPWDQRLEQLLQQKADWKAEADKHRHIKAVLAAEPEPDLSEPQAEVWSRLQASVDAVKPVSLRSLNAWWVYPAAAALLVVVLGAGYLLGSRVGTAGTNVAELQVQVPAEYHLELSGEGQLLKVSTLEGGAP